METKPWYQSKTIWVNLITLLISIIGIVITSATDLGISPEVVVVLTGVIVPVLNLFLRTITEQPITLKKK